MNDIITVNENVPTRRAEAEYLHYEILRNGADAAEAMCNLALNLKKMRDERLFVELGFDDFESYTVDAVGLKKSQAYDYIKVLECLGEDVFRTSGTLGISKVKILCAFTPADAVSFVENNDVDSMTVKELKAKVDELTKNGEQLTLDLAAATSVKDSKDEEIRKLRDEIYDLENINERLEAENEEYKNKPTEIAVREPSEDEIAKYSKKAIEVATAEYEKKARDAEEQRLAAEKQLKDSEKKHSAEIKKIKAEAEKAAKEKADAENAHYADEINRIKQHSAELEKRLKLSASPEITKFSFYFEAMQSDVKKVADALAKIDDADTVKKLKTNMCKYADVLKGMFKNEDQ